MRCFLLVSQLPTDESQLFSLKQRKSPPLPSGFYLLAALRSFWSDFSYFGDPQHTPISAPATASLLISAMASNSFGSAVGSVAGVNSDLWRECVAWLVRCKVIPSDHKAAQSDAEIRSLAMTLRDGVLLCNLVMYLEPNSMDSRELHRKPQMAQFLCSKNIKLFLDVCRNNFGIRDADLFEPTMLYDLTNFHRVLITLSKLSQCRKVQLMHPDLIGFNLQLSPSERSHSDEAIYKDLHSTDLNMRKASSIDASGSSSTEYYDLNSQSGSLSVEDENSDITIENGTEDIDDYIEDSLSNMCDSTIDPDEYGMDMDKGPLSAIQGSNSCGHPLDFTLGAVSSTLDSASVAVTATPGCYDQKNKSSIPSQAATSPAVYSDFNAPGSSMERLVSSSSSSKSVFVSESQRLQRAAAAVYNYRSSMASTEHEYAYIYSEDDDKVYEDLCYVTFQTITKPEVCLY